MGKIRVYELAKELNVESKKIIDILANKGVVIKNHMGVLEDNSVNTVRDELGGKSSKFKPKITRIPKAVVEAEAEAVAAAKEDVQQAAPVEAAKVEASKNEAPKNEAPQAKIEEPIKAVEKPAVVEKPAQPVAAVENPAVKAEVEVAPKAVEKTEVKPATVAASAVAATNTASSVQPTSATPVKPAEKPMATGGAARPGYQGNNNGGTPRPGYQGNNNGGTPRPGYQGNNNGGAPRPGYQGNNNGGAPRPGYQGNNNGGTARPGYQGNNNGGAPRPGYQGNNNGGAPRPGYQGNNAGGNRPGYQGNNNGGAPRPGYQGNNAGGAPRPGYQGNNAGGNRPGYQGNNAGGNRPGYQGNNAGGNRPGYQGNNAGGNRPGYQGNNAGGNRPGYQGNNAGGNRPGYQGNNAGGNRPAAAGEMRYTAPAPAKPVSRRVDNKKRDTNVKDKVFTNDKYKNNFDNNRNYRNRPRSKYKDHRKPVVMPPVVPKKIIMGETIILQELAKSMSKTASELIKKLFEMGIMATINQNLDSDTAILLADEFGITVEVKQEKVDEIMEDDTDNPRDLKERPPVVTVMGHVDHGKTSLLDAIRKTSVITTEAGGITQHIGAYQVEIQNKKITFLDTPGHEAFTSMRARGAQVTDISIVVVAADDGVMPQTVEAINHSKAAGVPIIVAINKVDKPGANPDKVKQELTEYGLVCEDWGGDVIMVPVSAKKGLGIDNLLEMILLVSEVAELKANPKRLARGTVIEAKLDKSRGPVTTLLVQKGTLKVGETVIAGSVFGKIRAMIDDKNRTVKSAGPSMPVEVLGFSEVPPPGAIFMVIKDASDARYAAQIQAIKKREEEMRKSSKVSLEDLFKHISDGDVKELNLVIKADVQGSAEAVRQSLENLSNDEVKVKTIHVGVGAISESDVTLADASNAIIIGFNVRPNTQTMKAAEFAGVDMRLYRVIYDAIEDVKKAMVGLLDPEYKEKVIGHAEVRNVFKVPKVGLIAGCYVVDGKVTRQAGVRIVRDGIVAFEGKVASLKRFKDDAKEVQTGFECGIGIDNFNDVKEGDTIEAFIMEETERKLAKPSEVKPVEDKPAEDKE